MLVVLSLGPEAGGDVCAVSWARGRRRCRCLLAVMSLGPEAGGDVLALEARLSLRALPCIGYLVGPRTQRPAQAAQLHVHSAQVHSASITATAQVSQPQPQFQWNHGSMHGPYGLSVWTFGCALEIVGVEAVRKRLRCCTAPPQVCIGTTYTGSGGHKFAVTTANAPQ